MHQSPKKNAPKYCIQCLRYRIVLYMESNRSGNDENGAPMNTTSANDQNLAQAIGTSTVDEYVVPVDPMDLLRCDSCQ